jgi:hypothetical protein
VLSIEAECRGRTPHFSAGTQTVLSIEHRCIVTNPALQCGDADSAEYRAPMHSDEPRTSVRGHTDSAE